MSRVFIINDMTHNFHKASRYGTLVKVTEGKVPIFKTDVVKNMLQSGLEGFKPGDDYLLISGPAILCSMAVLHIANEHIFNNDNPVEYIRVLVFDAKEQDYITRHLPV